FLQRLAVEANEKIVLVKIEDIRWMQSSGNHIRLHVAKASYLMRQSLKNLQALLDPARFLRVHRNAIVNLDHVEEFHLPPNGKRSRNPWRCTRVVVVGSSVTNSRCISESNRVFTPPRRHILHLLCSALMSYDKLSWPAASALLTVKIYPTDVVSSLTTRGVNR